MQKTPDKRDELFDRCIWLTRKYFFSLELSSAYVAILHCSSINEFLKKKKSTTSEIDKNFVPVLGQSPIYSSLFKKSISKKKWSRGA